MSTSQRVSRGFHRLALFLAAIPLLIGGYFSTMAAPDWTAPFSLDWRTGHDDLPQPPSGVELNESPIIQIEGIGKVRMFPGFEKLRPDEQQE
jgi:hypothetical protein